MDLYPFTYNEVVAMSLRWRRFLPAHYNMYAPQHMLSTYLFHKEQRHCSACKHGYEGHIKFSNEANMKWFWTHDY